MTHPQATRDNTQIPKPTHRHVHHHTYMPASAFTIPDRPAPLARTGVGRRVGRGGTRGGTRTLCRPGYEGQGCQQGRQVAPGPSRGRWSGSARQRRGGLGGGWLATAAGGWQGRRSGGGRRCGAVGVGDAGRGLWCSQVAGGQGSTQWCECVLRLTEDAAWAGGIGRMRSRASKPRSITDGHHGRNGV